MEGGRCRPWEAMPKIGFGRRNNKNHARNGGERGWKRELAEKGWREGGRCRPQEELPEIGFGIGKGIIKIIPRRGAMRVLGKTYRCFKASLKPNITRCR